MKSARKLRLILQLGLLGMLLFAVLLSCRGERERNNNDVVGIEPGGSIYGTVLFQGVGLADVALSLNSGPTLTTDPNGKYSLGMVPQGTYTITPSKSGYLFTPDSAAVTIVNYDDAEEVDFTASIVYNRTGVDQRYLAIYDLTRDVSCTDSAVCLSIGIGSKPCGGPWVNLVYSAATVDSESLNAAVADLNAYEAGYNQQGGLVSDCSLAPPANPGCVNFKCIDLNATQ